jgi:hypothetical protein
MSKTKVKAKTRHAGAVNAIQGSYYSVPPGNEPAGAPARLEDTFSIALS